MHLSADHSNLIPRTVKCQRTVKFLFTSLLRYNVFEILLANRKNFIVKIIPDDVTEYQTKEYWEKRYSKLLFYFN